VTFACQKFSAPREKLVSFGSKYLITLASELQKQAIGTVRRAAKVTDGIFSKT